MGKVDLPEVETKGTRSRVPFLSLSCDMYLSNLPSELILSISQFIDDEFSINALLQTCKRFHRLLNHALYDHNVRCSHASALEWAAIHGYENTARLALKSGASISAGRYQSLKLMGLACKHGHDSIVRLLIEHGVKPGIVGGWISQQEAEEEGDDDEEEEEDDDEGPPFMIGGDEDLGYPLALAALHGHEAVIKTLLTRGVSATAPMLDEGETPLWLAASRGHLSIVKLLVKRGCEIDTPHRRGLTPLHKAAEKGCTDVVRYLLQMGANCNGARRNPSTPMCSAASGGHLDIVELLLSHGASLGMEGWGTWTPPAPYYLTILPLALAAEAGHQAVAEKLRAAIDLNSIIAAGDPSDYPNNYEHQVLLLVSTACGWEEPLR